MTVPDEPGSRSVRGAMAPQPNVAVASVRPPRHGRPHPVAPAQELPVEEDQQVASARVCARRPNRSWAPLEHRSGPLAAGRSTTSSHMGRPHSHLPHRLAIGPGERTPSLAQPLTPMS